MALDTTLRWFTLRATNAFVTNGANQTPVTGDTGYLYPQNVTVGGDTVQVGWSADDDTVRDRDNTVDPRLAGMHMQTNTGTQRDFRIDLPVAGKWLLRLGIGDASNAQAYQYVQIRDTSTVLATIDDTNGTGVGEFLDATGAQHTSAANWVANEAGLLLTFATTILNIRAGSPAAQSNSTTLATIGLQRVLAEPPPGASKPRLEMLDSGDGDFPSELNPLAWFKSRNGLYVPDRRIAR